MCMTYTTAKIKNNSIDLPKEIGQRWNNTNVRVLLAADKLVIEGPISPKHRYDIAAWKKVAGLWKKRQIPDAVAWQRKIRREWERDLP